MDCKQFREYLDNYASLTAGERAQMTEHAKECEGCRAELEFMTSVIETVNSLPRITPPADFMDKLNARISAEERRNSRVSQRILKNLKTYRRQYAAAAACFALLAVIAVNGRMLTDNMNKSDDGIVVGETSNITPTENPASLSQPTVTQAPSVNVGTAEASDGNSANAAAQPNTQANVSEPTRSEAPVRRSESSSGSVSRASNENSASTSSSASSSGETRAAASTQENTNTVSADTNAGGESTQNSADYSAASSNEMMRVAAVPQDENGTADAYSLADDGTAVASLPQNEDGEDAIAVGKLRIATDSEEKAMSVIERYSYNVEDGFYEVNVENFAGMLSSLNIENVQYSDYTIVSGGIVRFQVDLMEK